MARQAESSAPFRGLSIRTHLIAFGLLCFLPAFIAAAFGGLDLAKRERDRVQVDLRRLVEGFSVAVDAEITQLTKSLQALATSRALAEGDHDAFRAQALRVAQDNDAAIALRDTSGRHILNTWTEPGSAPLTVTTDAVLRTADRTVIATGQPALSDLYMGAAGGRHFVSVVIPIQRGGEVSALLSIAVTPERITRQLRLGSLASTGWLAAVAGSDMRVIARTRDLDRFVGVPATGDLAAAIRERREGVLPSVTLDGVAVLTAFRKGANGWSTIVAVPEVVLNGPVMRVTRVLVVAGLIVVVVTVLGGWFYGRFIGSELATLAENARRMQSHVPLKPFQLRIGEVAMAQQALTQAGQNADELLRELDHRVKNTLSVVQAIAARTVSDPREKTTMTGRIAALTRAHEALSQARWEGVALDRLLRGILEDAGLGATMAGPGLTLSPRATTALAQVFQELADNARVHGALRAPAGRVDVAWVIDGEAFRLTWSERNGPPAPETYTRGFGLKVAELCTVRQLNGTLSITAATEGWTIVLAIPLQSPLGVAATPA